MTVVVSSWCRNHPWYVTIQTLNEDQFNQRQLNQKREKKTLKEKCTFLKICFVRILACGSRESTSRELTLLQVKLAYCPSFLSLDRVHVVIRPLPWQTT